MIVPGTNNEISAFLRRYSGLQLCSIWPYEVTKISR